MGLEKELQEVIKKNLPAHVGDVLKERLEQADQDATTVKNLTSENQDKEIKKLQEEIRVYMAFDVRNNNLDSREKALDDNERRQTIHELEYKLAAEKEKTLFTQGVAMGLVRNTEYRKNIFDSENPGGLPIVDGQGHTHYPMSTDKHYNETREEL